MNGPDAPAGSAFSPANGSVDDQGNAVRVYSFLQSLGTSELQDVTFQPSTQYTLTFDAAVRNGNPSGLTAGTLDVTIDDGSSPFTDPIAISSPDQFHFQLITFTTSPAAGAGSITFDNATPLAPAGSNDTTVDFTNVVLVPEPSSLAFLTFATLGLIARRARHSWASSLAI